MHKYRVHYWIYAAGGRLWPTTSIQKADSPEQAIEKAKKEEERETGLGFFRKTRDGKEPYAEQID